MAVPFGALVPSECGSQKSPSTASTVLAFFAMVGTVAVLRLTVAPDRYFTPSVGVVRAAGIG
ncbi:hypothetical protein [Actinoplanes regularis]|uniref:hypothetical protein n=1 Tax=Actinoplanes regularis TaxID=52697 RepID=UPI002553ADA7|nr:hypothetical protein [Actinoplanes regularis]